MGLTLQRAERTVPVMRCSAFKPLALAIGTLAAGAAWPAAAQKIHAGPGLGFYQTALCPRLSAELAKSRLDYSCTTSADGRENVARVAATPRDIGLAPLDLLAIEAAQHGGAKAFQRIRTGDLRECLFAVTRNPNLKLYGDLVANAQRLRFVLPPKGSGSAATFAFLQKSDPNGLGRADRVLHAADIREVATLSLAAEDTVGIFVAPPDPGSDDFRRIATLGGTVLPLLDRAILRQQIDGEKIYFAEETEITQARWTRMATKIVTACTPLVLFSGAPDRVSDAKQRQDHVDMIATVKALAVEQLLPQQGAFRRMLKRSRELSAAGVEKMLGYSETARERSRPYLDKAKEAGREALGKVKEKSKELIEKTAPGAGPRQP
jgi:hypothetical protein